LGVEPSPGAAELLLAAGVWGVEPHPEVAE
jgi:hypothetical protein